LLSAIAAKPEGLDIAIEILYMRLSFEEGRRQSSPAEIIDIGCHLLRQVKFVSKRDVAGNYRLGMLGKHCLMSHKGAQTVGEICRNLRDAVSKSETYAFYHDGFLRMVLSVQPIAALDALCEGDDEGFNLGMSILNQSGQLRGRPFDLVPEGELLGWCDQHPATRYTAVAERLTAFRHSADSGHVEWTSTAHKILDRAPNRIEVLKKFVGQFSPMSWAGSLATILESNARLLDDLADYPDPKVIEFIRAERVRIARVIESEKHQETHFERIQSERFE
jgi:hypothetical protein